MWIFLQRYVFLSNPCKKISTSSLPSTSCVAAFSDCWLISSSIPENSLLHKCEIIPYLPKIALSNFLIFPIFTSGTSLFSTSTKCNRGSISVFFSVFYSLCFGFIKLVNPFICFYCFSPLSPCTITSQCSPLSGPTRRMMPWFWINCKSHRMVLSFTPK